MNVNIYFSLVLLISVFILVYIGYFSWKKEKIYISVCLLAVSIYEFGYAFEILGADLEWIKFWIKVEYLGIVFLPLSWLMFCLNFTGYKDKIKKNIIPVLFILPVIILIIHYTNDFHHLFYTDIYINEKGPFPIVKTIKGPWYLVNIIYTYVLMAIGVLILMLSYRKAVAIVKKQISFIIFAWSIPWIADVVYELKLAPFGLDLCPLTFALSGIIFAYAILNYKLIKLTPIAMEKVFSNMLDGVIIVDTENNIVNFNNSAKNVIKELRYINAGDKKIEEVLTEYEEVVEVLNSDSYEERLITIKDKEMLRYYKMDVNYLSQKNGKMLGRILTFNDVTEIEESRKKLADSFNFLQTLTDAIPNPIYSKNGHGIYNHCNNAFTDFLGVKKEEVLGKTADDLFEKDYANVYKQSDNNLMNKKEAQIYESKLKNKDGTYHDVIFSKAVIKDEEGAVNGVAGVILDVTEQKRNEEKIKTLLKLKESMIKIGYSINEISDIKDLLQLILDEVINCIDDRSTGSVLHLEEDKKLRIAVARGYRPEDIKDFFVNLNDHLSWFNRGKKINETVISNGLDKLDGIKMLKTEKGVKIKSAICSPIIIEGELYGFLNIDSVYDYIFDDREVELMEYMRNQAASAIAKHKLYEETLYLSRYDKLTNVYNRGYLEQLFYADIYNNEISSDDKSISGNRFIKDNRNKKGFYVVLFDLNELKLINDNYGHLVGDELIKRFAAGLISLTGGSDIIGRFGGDEFVGIFFHVDYERLVNRLESLLKHFRDNPILLEENEVICSFSYGIVRCPDEGRDFNDLVKIADERMYEYKRISKIRKEN